tara:strand:- start:65503 stop:65667 length:165 start_codon:yes stop_codon:yes gene_type:complete
MLLQLFYITDFYNLPECFKNTNAFAFSENGNRLNDLQIKIYILIGFFFDFIGAL